MAVKQNVVRIFVSYAHEDFHHREALTRSLAALQHSGKALVWHDGRIEPGREWETSIRAELQRSNIVVVLVTSNFFNSIYCIDQELVLARKREVDGFCDVVPVLVEDCDHVAHWLGKLQMLPEHAGVLRPVAEFRPVVKGWTKVAAAIRIKVESLLKNSSVLQTLDGREEVVHSGQRELPVATGAGSETFENVSAFWRAQDRLPQLATATVQATLSCFAPLVMGPPKAKRALHKEFRQIIETNRSFGKQKSLTIDTCMSVSAGQMVVRESTNDKPKLLLGLYSSIVRNSIPVFVKRDYYERVIEPLFEKSGNSASFEATVSGRVFQLDNTFIRRFLVRQGLNEVLSKSNVDDLCENTFALEVGDEGTSIVPRSEPTHYLDGDIWLAIRKPDGTERFITSFVDLTDGKERDQEFQVLTEQAERIGAQALVRYDRMLSIEELGGEDLDSEGSPGTMSTNS